MKPTPKTLPLLLTTLTLILTLSTTHHLHAQADDKKLAPKPPTQHTINANQRVLQELPFTNQQDYQDAKRGLLAAFNTMIDTNGNIVDSTQRPAWNMKAYAFENTVKPTDALGSVNPSLWRQAQLNNFAGLFEVIPGKVYQIRGFDLSVMTLIMGTENGQNCWIIIDPLVNMQTSKAGLSLANQKLGDRPVRAVIYTHSHIDHYGGVLGVADTNSINTGKIRIYAPEAFLEHAVTENLMAGTAMGRRATYMYGNLLFDKNPMSEVDAGLGKTTSGGDNNIIRPDTADIIPSWAKIERPARRNICGVNIDFWYTPETEAPAEMMFYFPDWNALCAAELVTHTMHNVYSLRGAAVRDALSWSGYIDDVMQTYGSGIQVIFASHHWPTWGNSNIMGLLQKQRDLYKYLNDQTFRLFNQGYTMIEIGEMVKLPDSLSKIWANRQYYGTINHNVKALYQRSLGWFDGNPANLHTLPPVEAGKKYVQYMGGASNLMKNAKADFAKGEYRWVAMAVNHLVFADPKNMEARLLLADTYEQMGYQAESGPWRNFYLTGARELRNPLRVQGMNKLMGDPIPNIQSMSQMSAGEYFQYIAIHLNGLAAGNKNYTFQMELRNDVMKMKGDAAPVWAKMRVTNGVLNSYVGNTYVNPKDPNVPTIHINQSTMFSILTTGGTEAQFIFKSAVADGQSSITGGTPAQQQDWIDFLGMLEKFEFWFNIVEP